MGMFDSVIVDCDSCGEYVEFQSKAGDCHLAVYSIDSLPPFSIIADLTDSHVRCSCGKPVDFPLKGYDSRWDT